MKKKYVLGIAALLAAIFGGAFYMTGYAKSNVRYDNIDWSKVSFASCEKIDRTGDGKNDKVVYLEDGWLYSNQGWQYWMDGIKQEDKLLPEADIEEFFLTEETTVGKARLNIEVNRSYIEQYKLSESTYRDYYTRFNGDLNTMNIFFQYFEFAPEEILLKDKDNNLCTISLKDNTIVLFIKYNCPYCEATIPIISDYISENPDCNLYLICEEKYKDDMQKYDFAEKILYTDADTIWKSNVNSYPTSLWFFDKDLMYAKIGSIKENDTIDHIFDSYYGIRGNIE